MTEDKINFLQNTLIFKAVMKISYECDLMLTTASCKKLN